VSIIQTFDSTLLGKPATVEFAEDKILVRSTDSIITYDKSLTGLSVRMHKSDDQAEAISYDPKTGKQTYIQDNADGTSVTLEQLPQRALDVVFEMGIKAIAHAYNLQQKEFPGTTGELALKILAAHKGHKV
jgi:hypothetical protein